MKYQLTIKLGLQNENMRTLPENKYIGVEENFHD